MAGKTRNLQKVESNFVNLKNEGDAIEGTILSRDTVTFKKGSADESTVGRYTLVDDDGAQSVLLGSTVLDDRLENIPDGTYVRVVYLGSSRSGGGNPVKGYDIFVDV